MRSTQPTRKYNLPLALRKYFVSGVVVFTFAAYAVHEKFSPASASDVLPDPTKVAAQAPNPTKSNTIVVNNAPQLATVAPRSTVAAPTAIPPTAVPQVAKGQYRDGSYTGVVANAYYGTVQVQAVIQGGKIADVQFLDFPQDRRTSQRINAVAVPYLRNEAIQAQAAQVNIISGATLTSRAFIQSLQTALDSARA